MVTLFWYLEDKIGNKYLMIIVCTKLPQRPGLIMSWVGRYPLPENAAH